MNGIVSYTFGESYFLQCVVFLNSLRKHCKEKVDLYVLNAAPSKEKMEIFDHYNVNVKILTATLNSTTYCTIKPLMVDMSEFDRCLVLDSDLLVVNKIDELFNFEKPFLLAQSGQILSDNETLKDEIRKVADLGTILNQGKQYANIGILGINKNTQEFTKYKEEIKNSINRCNYNDEVIFNIIYNDRNTHIVDFTYNVLPNTIKIVDDTNDKIVHFAGWSFSKKSPIKHTENNVKKWFKEADEVMEKFNNYNFDMSKF
jgi:lipopolysaccharide biosynthesis glycosyltransferase